nr:hypothetical protein BaRGS_007906 [Batillaria attramentaria]
MSNANCETALSDIGESTASMYVDTVLNTPAVSNTALVSAKNVNVATGAAPVMSRMMGRMEAGLFQQGV